MKTNQMKKALTLSLSIAVLAMAACSTGADKQAEHSGAIADSVQTKKATPVVKAQFEDPKTAAVYESYLNLKNAMVASNSTEAQSAAASLQTALSDAGNSKGADHAGKIASVTDLTAQRAELEGLTAEVEKVVKSSKPTTGVIYKQYCPMANNNAGGYWLSSESDIRNPYFGDDMLECGETKEEIK
jgi:hypothetical protein